jgi:hypothetical protein
MSHHEHVVGDQLDLTQGMAGQEHRAAFVRKRTHVSTQPPHARGVEAVGRLVQDEHRGSPSMAAAIPSRWRIPREKPRPVGGASAASSVSARTRSGAS